MTTYNTGNALGSPAVKDLYDNAENFDAALNDSTSDSWTDRLGRVRKTWFGMESQFNQFMESSDEQFQQFLLSSGYQDLGDYAAGLQITSRNQVFRKDGELYRAAASLELPYTLSGDWVSEGSNFLSVGDAVLRQDLSGSGGSELVGFLGTNVATQLRSSLQRVSHLPFANSNVVQDGSVDGYNRHGAQLVEAMNGRLLLYYGKNTQHAITPGATAYGSFSDAGGTNWSIETELIPSDPDADQRGLSVCVTPRGTVLVNYSRVVAPEVPTGPTVFRQRRSSDNGESFVQGPEIFSVPFTYARAYGRIKVVPGGVGGQHRLVWTPYYQSSSAPSPTYRVAVLTSTDDGLNWVEQAPIVDSTFGFSEAEIVAISATLWFAVLRSPSGIFLFKTENAGGSWTQVGIVPLTSTDSYVAPTLDRFKKNGRWYLLLGYCNRTNTGGGDRMIWRIALVDDVLGALGANAWGGVIAGATDMQNASGYQSPVAGPDGDVYIDGGLAYAEIKEYDGQPYSQLRFARIGLEGLALAAGRSATIAADVLTVSSSDFETFVFTIPEGGAATDDVWTINGGREGQIVTFRSSSSTQDPTFRISRDGVGNLLLRSDYRSNTTDSRLVLRYSAGFWVELGRAADYFTSSPAIAIANDTISIPPALDVLSFSIDTEAGAATDTLSSINGGTEGQHITLTSASSSRDTTITTTGNIRLAGGANFTLLTAADAIMFLRKGANWLQVARSTN